MSSDEPVLIGDEITVRGATYQRDSQGRWCWVMVDVDSRTTEWGLVNIGEHHMLDEIERLRAGIDHHRSQRWPVLADPNDRRLWALVDDG